jgi:two-component system sensor histidine kinase TctE
LQRLQSAISTRSHLDLSPLDESESLEEVRPLIHAINDLMQRLSHVLDAQNRFIADAAHQLRTPLAGLKAQIELIVRGNDPSAFENDMLTLRASTDRLTRLVNQLLALARNEPAADRVSARQALDINQLASTLTMARVPEALKKNIDLGYESQGAPGMINGDASRLKDLIDNLIDNAIRYTQPDGRITVSVSNDSRITLMVTDNGPGIPVDQRERVFERFYSVLGNGADGSGLGLAIVREIARMHGAQVNIGNGPDDTGTRISVVFQPSSPTTVHQP